MFPVINLHRVDCKVCRSDVNECVKWDAPLTPAETAPEETTVPQALIFNSSGGEVESHLPLLESPQHQGEFVREDVTEQGKDSDDESPDYDEWTPLDTSAYLFGHLENFSFQFPAAATEEEDEVLTDSSLGSLNKHVDPIHNYLRNHRPDRNTLVNPFTSKHPGEQQSTSTTCSNFCMPHDLEEEDEQKRVIAEIRCAQSKHAKRRPRSPLPFDYIVPNFGRDYPLFTMMTWKADAWALSYNLAGDDHSPGWYPIYIVPQSTDTSRTPSPHFSVTQQNNQAQHSSWCGNSLAAPDEVRAHISNAASDVGQNCRNQMEQSSSRKRRRETNTPNSSHSSETESSPSKMSRPENEQE
ncbi:uncharacterized protein LOC143526082 [Brachyhypopomus gauderio]|uniref:uncharacterized protein LOC143526082 n=1 Tax=Brachyhypopomus gauderio TaxID=698409 RepID=UPI004042FFB9